MTTKDKNNIESQLSSLVEAITAINVKVDGLHENQAKINTELNARVRNYAPVSRVYESPNGGFWGTGVATCDIKKGQEIALTLQDAPNSKPKPNYPNGKQAYNFVVKVRTPKVEENQDPSTTPEEARDQKQAPVTTEKGELVSA